MFVRAFAHVCMYVCICVCVCICMCVQLCINCTDLRFYTGMRACLPAWLRGCMHASMCVYKCMCVLLGTHARMGVCANACTKHYLQLSLSYLHPNSNNTRVQTIKEIFLCRKGYF